ncbi:MAG: sporulation protein YqfD [Clostridia bacterium]|nr:sporulation protein YqfD [Clostridia bacterium]
MLLTDIITAARGSCKFAAVGDFPERFLNLCSRAEMGLWDIKRTEDGLTARIIASKYRRLRPMAKKCGLRLSVKERKGLPFRMMPYRKRAGMPLGFILFWGIIWLMSLFVWFIDMPQVSPEVQPKLQEALEQSGVVTGALRSRLDGNMLSTELEMKVNELSWAGVSIIGSRVIVDVRELEKIAPPIDSSQACNIVASKGGVIISAQALEGVVEIEVGQAVAKGDLLIGGVVELAGGSIEMVHSRGEVWAKTDYELQSTVSLHHREAERTGRCITIRRLMALGVEIPLHIGKLPEGDFERENESWQLSLGSADLPLIVRTERWYERKTVNREIDHDEAERLAREDIERQIEQLGEVEILSREEEISYYDDSVVISVSLSAKEEIGVKELILFE